VSRFCGDKYKKYFYYTFRKMLVMTQMMYIKIENKKKLKAIVKKLVVPKQKHFRRKLMNNNNIK